MRKFLIAAAACLLIFGAQAQASPVDNQIETQELGKWAHFRDKYIIGRETENERRDRKEWERRYREDYRHHERDRYRYGPPPNMRGHYPPPPPRGYYPPPPPTRRR